MLPPQPPSGNPPHAPAEELLAAVKRLREENARLREQNNQLRRSLQSYLLKGRGDGLHARAG